MDQYCLEFILMILLMHVTCLILNYLLMMGPFIFENICWKTYLSIRIEMSTILKLLNVNKL